MTNFAAVVTLERTLNLLGGLAGLFHLLIHICLSRWIGIITTCWLRIIGLRGFRTFLLIFATLSLAFELLTNCLRC